MRLPVVFLLITMVIDAMGIGLILPVMPDLITSVTGQDLSGAALWGGVLSFVFAVMQFLFAPMIGSLSDWFGRRPVLLLALAVMALDYMIMALAGTIWLLLIGRIVGGITAATQATAAAYMADISAPEDKARNFGLIGAAFGAGFVLGPTIGGLLGQFGTRAPFYAAAALTTVNLVFGYLILKETVTDEIRRPFDIWRANPFGAFKALSKMPVVTRGMLIYFFYEVAFFAYPAIWAYFGKIRFGWDVGMIGLSLGAFGVMMVLTQGVLIGPILKKLGERGTLLAGLVFNALAFLAMAFVTSGTWALVLTALTALGAISGPALQGLLSRSVGDDQQGELQGAFSSVAAVSMIVSPLLMTSVFSTFTKPGADVFFPGAPFIVSLVLILICVVIVATDRRQNVVA